MKELPRLGSRPAGLFCRLSKTLPIKLIACVDWWGNIVGLDANEIFLKGFKYRFLFSVE